MSRRRLVVAALFSLLMAAVLAVVVYTEQQSAAASVNVWILVHDVPAGAQFSAADVQQVSIRASVGDFNYEAQGPAQVSARYARPLAAHDIVRTDDLVPSNLQAEVALTIQNPPPLNSGDAIDVYAATAAGSEALIGRGLTVEQVAGSEVTVLVSSSDEGAWIAIGSSSVPLHVARVAGAVATQVAPVNPATAISILCGPPCAG